MLVVSLPRSGGTKFCMDLAEKTGLPFAGDMQPDNIRELGSTWAKVKEQFHETQCDQSLPFETYIDVLRNLDRYVVLCNAGNHLMLPHADKFILRRNRDNVFRSLANYWLKIIPQMHHETLISSVLRPMMSSASLIYTWVDMYDCDVVWYEDYFNDKPCLTPALDAYENKDYILRAIYENNEGHTS